MRKLSLLLILVSFITVLPCRGQFWFGAPQVNKTLKTERDGFQWYRIAQNGKYGAEDKNHNTLIPLSRGYTMIVYDTHGFFGVHKGEHRMGACDRTGKEIIPPQWYHVMYSYESEYGCRVFYYYKSSLDLSEKILTDWTLDDNGRAIKAPYISRLIEDIKYNTYMVVKNGEPDLNILKNVCDGVRFDFASTSGKILVKIMKDGNSQEVMAINPSESNLHIESGVIKISFTEYGTSKLIGLIKKTSGSDAVNSIMLLDDASTNTGKFFGKLGVNDGIGRLTDEISQYRGNNFDVQFNRLESELKKFQWFSRK